MRENGFEPVVIMQATHSGRYSKPEGVPAPLIAYNNPIFEGDKPIAAERILSDDYLYGLIDKFGASASLAEQAGFDGVDIKCCHRYLNSELLSAYTRKGDFGGRSKTAPRLLRSGVAPHRPRPAAISSLPQRLNVYDGFCLSVRLGRARGRRHRGRSDRARSNSSACASGDGHEAARCHHRQPYFNPHVNRRMTAARMCRPSIRWRALRAWRTVSLKFSGQIRNSRSFRPD